MNALRFILGLLLILVAIAFAKAVTGNWQSVDPKAHGRIVIDSVLTVVISAGGAVLLYDFYKNNK
jgi:uncharacterized membrane protein YidH (DUF202 family)